MEMPQMDSVGTPPPPPPPPPPPRTKWTRRVPHPVLIGHAASPHPVLIGHAASLSQVGISETEGCDAYVVLRYLDVERHRTAPKARARPALRCGRLRARRRAALCLARLALGGGAAGPDWARLPVGREETYSPEWHETFVLPLERLSATTPLVLQVWDSDEERDELIGQCTVNFYDMPKAVRQERWCTISA